MILSSAPMVPFDVWRRVFATYVDDVDDIRAFSRTCRRHHEFVTRHLNVVKLTLRAPHQVSMRFLPTILGMHTLTIHRVYHTRLDLWFLGRCKALRELRLNNGSKLANVPATAPHGSQHQGLRIVIPERPTRLKNPSRWFDGNAATASAQAAPLITPKEYFMSRYATRHGKYGSKRFGFSI